MQTIEMRLQKLEATNRRYKTALVFFIATFTLILFMSFRNTQSVPEILQAKKFEIVDNNGNVLLMLSQDDGKGMLKTYNKEGKRLVNITYTANQEGYLGLENGKGQETMRFSSSSDVGGGYISIYNNSGKRTLILNNDKSGGNVYVCNNNGDTRALMQCNSSAGGSLGLYNSNGYSALKLTQTTSGNGDFYVNNYNGDERVRISVSSSAGNFQIRNNSKNRIIELGGTAGEAGTFNTYNNIGTFIQGIGSSN